MARIVSAWLGSACSRFVAYTNQPLIGYGLPVSVASRMPVVMASLANGIPAVRVVDLAALPMRIGRVGVSRARPCWTGSRSRPPVPQLPSSAFSSAIARLRCASSPYQVTCRPGWTSVAGRWRAISRAVSRIASGGMPVSGYAHSGVQPRFRRGTASKPKPSCSTNSRSYRLSVDEHVHPGQQQREVGARPDRQVVLRLARRDRESRDRRR